MGTVLIRFARLVTIAVVMLAVRSAGAVPSFARQTGFDCTVCHTIFPELTPIGRRFKLYGYTWTNKEPEATIVAGRDPAAPAPAPAPAPSTTTMGSPIRLWLSRFPPISFVLFASMTAWNRRPVDTDAAGNMYSVQQPLVLFPQEVSLVYAGRISDASGLFAELTYEQTEGGVGIDTVDLRYIIYSDGDLLDANGRRVDLLLGLTFNNGPTTADVWATGGSSVGAASAFGVPNFPVASELAKPRGPLLYDLAEKSAAVGVYAFLRDALYLELAGYVAAQPGVQRISSDPVALTSSGGAIDYVAPYWRFGYERNWDRDRRSLMVGTTGMFSKFTQPGAATRLPAASYLDVGLDAQYQMIEPSHILTLHGSWMHEQTWNTTALVGTAISNARDRLDRLSLGARYFYDRTYGALVNFVDVSGTNDVLANCGTLPACNGSPAARWLTFEAYWMARLNVQLFVHYDAFVTLDSASNAFAALPRPKVSDNNLFLAGIWLAF
jgi:hypothetical protein